MSGLGLQTSKPPHRSNRCGAGRWVVSWECHISALALAPAPGTPLVCQSRTPTPTPRVGCASGPPTPTDSDLDFSGHGHGLGVTFTASFAQCLLFAQRAHPGSSVGGHSHLHSNRQFQALGYTGVVTTAPTFTYALFVETNVWNSHCDGAYPQPQWNCACSAYNSSSQVTSRLRRSVNQYALNSGSATPSEGIQLSPVFG